MSSITTVGYVRRDLESLREWCRQQSATEQSISSRYASSRTHKWFGHEVVLTKPAIITKGYQDNRVTQFGNIVLPGWHCALLCHYRPGGRMNPHCDHLVFEPLLVLVNIGCATLRVDKEVRDLEPAYTFSVHLRSQQLWYCVVGGSTPETIPYRLLSLTPSPDT